MKEALELKFDTKRRISKDLELQHLRQISDLTKERAVLEEKLTHADFKRDELKNKYESDIAQLKEQLSAGYETIARERDAFASENERLRTLNQECERELSDV